MPGPPYAVGLSQGKLSAQPSGGLAYEMPIVVSPGTSGMQPKLSFQYSSGAKNGPLGVGWAIGGLSAIARAPQTRAQDNGSIRGVDMTLNDRYTIDGQRLIATLGSDGYPGTQYRTEINSFTKVVSNSQSGKGPATFTAWTKSGLIYTFGGGSASYVPAGRTDGTILAWLVSKVQDHAGNYMTFQYNLEGSLTRIDYTMNASGGLGSYASVVCLYDNDLGNAARPDPAFGYVAGSQVSITRRLDRVVSYYGSQIVRQYDLTYKTSPTTGKLRLADIKESAIDGNNLVSYPPTSFGWDENTNSITFHSSLFVGNQQDNTHWAQGDFDTDGIVDMARMRDGTIKVYHIGDLRNPVWNFNTSPFQNFDSQKDTWLQGDFSGDGKLDLLRVHGTDGNPIKFTTFTNTGTTFTQATVNDAGGPLFYPTRIFMAMDANGDGKLDVVCINGVSYPEGNTQDLRIFVYINNGNASFTASQWNYTSFDDAAYTAPNSDKCAAKDRWLVADFNGDGLPDLARVWENARKNTVRIFANQNGSFSGGNRIFKSGTFYEYDRDTEPVAYLWLTGDFNGDGAADIVRVPKSGNIEFATNADVYLSTGGVSSNNTPSVVLPPFFSNPQPWASILLGEQAKIQTGDYNADGRSDIVILKDHVKGTSSGFQTPEGGSVSFGIPSDPTNDPTGLTAFLDDPVIVALRAKENMQLTAIAPPRGLPTPIPTPTPDPCSDCPHDPTPTPAPLPSINYPSGSEADAVLAPVTSAIAGAASEASTYTYSLTRAIYLSNGSGFYRQVLQDDPAMEITSSSVPNFGKWFAADFNGDGKEDIVRRFSTTDSSGNTLVNFNIYRNEPGFQDLLRTATDGMGLITSVDWQPLTGINNVPVFRKSSNAVSPTIDLITPLPVVASIQYDDGRWNSPSYYIIKYFYEGLKADPLRGLLGFESVEAIDTRAVDGSGYGSLRSKIWLNQAFPYTGMARRVIAYLGSSNVTEGKTDGDSSGLFSLTTSDYLELESAKRENPRVRQPYSWKTRAQSWDVQGVQTSDTETIVQRDDHDPIDAYGNIWGSTIKTKNLPYSDYFIKTTKSEYTPKLTDWCIGEMTSSRVYHDAPGQAQMVRKSGFAYSDANCQLNAETVEPDDSANWMRTDYEFDAFGNTKKAIVSGNDMSPAGTTRVTETIYDARGRFVETTINAMGHVETRDYDQRYGGVSSIIGPNGIRDTAQYDGFGRKRQETRFANAAAPDSPINTYISYEWVKGNTNPNTYPPDNRSAVYLVRAAADDGAETVIYFDSGGREVRKQTIDFKNRVIFVDTDYDWRGRKERVTQPYFKDEGPVFAAFTVFDALDRVVQACVPSVDESGATAYGCATTVYSGLTTTVYNPIRTQANPNGQTTTTTKDAAGHVKQVKDALNGTIDYTYDAVGQLIQTRDVAGNITTIHYDPRGRKDWGNDPDLGYWQYRYYSTGELKWQKDAKNQQVNFQYDQLGRTKQRNDPTGDVTIWEYDHYSDSDRGRGKLHSVTFTPATGSQLSPYSNVINYDSLGRARQQTTTIAGASYVTSTSYDSLSRPQVLSYPNGFTVKQGYTNGYLTGVTNLDGSTSYWTLNESDAYGNVVEERYGNGAISDRIYNPENGRLKEIHSGVGVNFNSVQNLEYRFDVIGNLKKRKDNNQTIGGNVLTETFDYDDLNRLASAKVTTANGLVTKSFNYDLLGNIQHKDDVGDYTYDPVHKHAVRTAGNSAIASYDANGNMMSGFGRTITWTWFNMPERIEQNNASSYFTYDPGHNRITQRNVGQNGLTITTYVGGLYEDIDKDNEIEHRCYINAPTGRVAIRASHVSKQAPYGTTIDLKYLHKDHLGSVDVVTNESGAVIERNSFDAWGYRRATDWRPPTNIPGPVPSNLRSIVTRGFTDHEQLDDFGLVHMNGRIYDPGIGRFLSADPFVQAPIQTQNFNRYSYVLNNPLSLTDPSGFNFLNNFGNWLDDVFGHTVGAVIKAVISYVAYAVTYAALNYVAGPVVATLGAGFVSGFLSTSLSGASLGQALQGGAVFAGIAVLSRFGAQYVPAVAQPVLQGGFGAAISAAQNQSPRDGFIAAFVAAALGPSPGTNNGGFSGTALRVVASAVAGGTAAELTGGNFVNGAITAGFVRLFTAEISMTSMKSALTGLVDSVIGKGGGAAWRGFFNWVPVPGFPEWGKVPATLAEGIGKALADARTLGDPAVNGYHPWHAATMAYMVQQLGLIGAPLIFLAGVFHELDFRVSFWQEQANQGTINHFLDSVGDIVANTVGIGVGLFGGSVTTAARWGNYIPGPTDPDPNFGFNVNRPQYSQTRNPVAAWGPYW